MQIDVLLEYMELFKKGRETVTLRKELLLDQRNKLIKKKRRY